MTTIDVLYDLTCAASDAARFARDIALEQTVEVPEAVATAADLPAGIVGEVADIQPRAGAAGCFRATIRYGADLAALQLPQLLNLLYGNISIKNNVRIVDVSLPAEFIANFKGPNYGDSGLRRLLGVYDRPLLATAIKPRGARLDHLTSIVRDFALGGGDIIKDDHNLVDLSFDAFETRVTACQRAVEEANAGTGHHALYFPMLMPPADQLERHIDFLLSRGIRGVLVCPFIQGVDTIRHLAETHRLAIMAHPAFCGTFLHDETHGIAAHVLLGTLLRLAAADASIFPNHGGRFAFTRERCASISRALREPLGNLKPAMPVPAGGMRFESIPDMAELYQADAIFLIGGALLSHSRSLRDSTAAFVERVGEHFSPRYTPPERDLFPLGSACEHGVSELVEGIRTHLRFNADFTWQGRSAVAYKSSAELPFRDVERTELVGKTGEPAAFDLRYFQIAPQGFTSLERHRHIHAVICARGRGVLLVDERRIELRPLDVAYIEPNAVHQLRNESTEPLGFFCIVDRERDQPRRP